MIFATNMAYLYTLVDKWYYHTSFKIWAKRKGGGEKHQLSVGDAATTSAALDTTRKGYRHQLSMLKEQKDNRTWIMKFVTTSKLPLSNKIKKFNYQNSKRIVINPLTSVFIFIVVVPCFSFLLQFVTLPFLFVLFKAVVFLFLLFRAAIKENAESP